MMTTSRRSWTVSDLVSRSLRRSRRARSSLTIKPERSWKRVYLLERKIPKSKPCHSRNAADISSTKGSSKAASVSSPTLSAGRGGGRCPGVMADLLTCLDARLLSLLREAFDRFRVGVCSLSLNRCGAERGALGVVAVFDGGLLDATDWTESSLRCFELVNDSIELRWEAVALPSQSSSSSPFIR